MKGTILLNYNENTRQVEEEEKARFLRGILEQCFENTEVANQVQEIWDIDGPLPAPQKIKLRDVLATYNLQVIDDFDGGLKIYLENELVANWKKPYYKLMTDLSQVDRKKRLYLEMCVECWSVFENLGIDE
jgi:hypothetical protein